MANDCLCTVSGFWVKRHNPVEYEMVKDTILWNIFTTEICNSYTMATGDLPNNMPTPLGLVYLKYKKYLLNMLCLGGEKVSATQYKL